MSLRVGSALVAIFAASAVLADGYIANQPEKSAAYKAAIQVAEAGCSVKAMEWANLVLENGGVAGDAVETLTQMRDHKEITEDKATRSFRLNGVFGC